MKRDRRMKRHLQMGQTLRGGPAAEGSGTTLLALRGYYIVSDSPVTGSFWCDDRRYNQVYDLIAEAMDSNLKSVHTDCPTIEKTAWLEESHLLAPSLMFYRDVRDLWRKIFCDAATDQYSADTAENGLDGKPFFPRRRLPASHCAILREIYR